jgi:hypothetical protein
VITWTPERRPNGETYKAITSFRRFEDYAEAQRYLVGLGPGNHEIVSRDPMKTCVPLEALTGYRLVYESPDGNQRPTGLGSVRVYEYVGAGADAPPTLR